MPRTRATGTASAAAADKSSAESRLSDELTRVVPRMDAIIGYKLRRAQLSVFQDFLQTFAKMKLRPAEFSVLAMIADAPGQKQTEIAGQLGIKRANFVALMDGLDTAALAARLGLTASSAQTYCQRVYRKLGVAGQRELLAALLASSG